MKKTNHLIISIFIALTFLTIFMSCTGKQPKVIDYDYLKKQITTSIEDKMETLKVVGVSVALVDDDKIIWSKGFGYSDRDEDIDATSDTLFEVGSISKLFVATAIMQLVEQGKINLDKPVQEYIKEFSIKTRYTDAEPITVRTLMTHHSGLPCDKIKGMFITDETKESYRDEVAYLKEVHAPYKPNYIWAYSNLAVDMLGIIIERVTGMDFYKYIEENILKPLEMNNSSFIIKEEMKPLISKGYDDSGKGNDTYYLRNIPAGGLRSSSSEMANFLKMVVNGGSFNDKQILKKETLEQMFTPQNKDIALDFNFEVGLNWFLSDHYAGKLCFHDGGTVFFHSMLEIIPEQKLGVIVLTNSNNGFYISQMVAKDILNLAVQVKTGIEKPEKKPKFYKKITVSKEELAKYEGEFATSIGLVTVKSVDDGLQLSLLPGLLSSAQTIKLDINEDGWFSLKDTPSNYFRIGIVDINGEKVLAFEQEGIRMPIGKEYIKKPIPEIWQNRAGQYKIIDYNKDDKSIGIPEVFNFKYENGYLLLSMSSERDFVKIDNILTPINDTEIVIEGLGRGMMETIYFKTINREEIVEYSGLHLKKVGVANISSNKLNICSDVKAILSIPFKNLW